MSDEQPEMLPCPNPWCEHSDPVINRGTGSQQWRDWYQVRCARCGIGGPFQPNRVAAATAWNTRCSVELGEADESGWHDAAQPAPEGQPVLAVYRAWGRPDGKLMKHLVWWREGEWRIYPLTANRGHVERWRPLAAG